MKSRIESRKIIVLMLLTTYLCGAQSVSHSGELFWGLGEALGGAGEAVGAGLGGAGEGIGAGFGAAWETFGVHPIEIDGSNAGWECSGSYA